MKTRIISFYWWKKSFCSLEFASRLSFPCLSHSSSGKRGAPSCGSLAAIHCHLIICFAEKILEYSLQILLAKVMV